MQCKLSYIGILFTVSLHAMQTSKEPAQPLNTLDTLQAKWQTEKEFKYPEYIKATEIVDQDTLAFASFSRNRDTFLFRIHILNLDTGQVTKQISCPQIQTLVAYGKDKLISASYDDQTIRIWDIDTGQEIKKFSGYADRALKVIDKDTLMGATSDHSVYFWNIDTGANKLEKSELMVDISARLSEAFRVLKHLP